jgi:predicted DNA-binding transcriptional regulator AlpA
MMKPVAVPTLNEILDDPSLAAPLPPDVKHALLLRALLVAAALATPPATNGHGETERAGDRLLTAAEAAPRLSVSVDWLWRHSRQLPFTVRGLGARRVRFSEAGLAKYLAQRQGRS